jgi:hypothetical protein
MHSNYKGPFINRSYSFISSSEVKITPKYALKALSDQTQLPSDWSWRNKGGNKIEDGRRNQGQCGSCWAVSLVSALGDRYAIKYNIAAPYPSAMLMISCIGPKIFNGFASASQQCLCGGSPSAAAQLLENPDNSIGMESCWPYSTVSAGKQFVDNSQGSMYVAPNCPITDSNCCADCCGYTNGISNVKFNIQKASTKSPLLIISDETTADAEETINLIKHDIFTNGPIATTFFVPDDFQTWWIGHKDNDIYTPTVRTNFNEGHGVVLTGWGKDENGQQFWEMRNSWGNLPKTDTKPATSDYCRFRMSTDILDRTFWTGIDIPIYTSDTSGQGWAGGTISFLPGELSKEYNWPKATGGHTGGHTGGGHHGGGHTGGGGHHGGDHTGGGGHHGGGHTGGHTGGGGHHGGGHTSGSTDADKKSNIFWIIGIVSFCILIIILLIIFFRG